MSNNRKSKKPQSRANRFPPSRVLKPVQSRVLRFSTSNLVDNVPIDRNCLLKLLYTTDLSGTRGKTLYSGVRLKRVQMWATPTEGSTTMVSCSVEWQSSRGPTTLISDSGNATVPAHVDSKPPKDSDASYWSQVSSSTTIRNEILFYITCPIHTIVDITICYVEGNGTQAGPPSESIAINTVVGGPFFDALIANSLDNSVGASLGGNRIKAVDLFTACGV
jgi:hypothetical protein